MDSSDQPAATEAELLDVLCARKDSTVSAASHDAEIEPGSLELPLRVLKGIDRTTSTVVDG